MLCWGWRAPDGINGQLQFSRWSQLGKKVRYCITSPWEKALEEPVYQKHLFNKKIIIIIIKAWPKYCHMVFTSREAKRDYLQIKNSAYEITLEFRIRAKVKVCL